MSMENWPFIIVRCFGTGARNNDFIRCTFDAQKQHPGLINEIWFSGYRFRDWDYNEKFVQESLPYRDECKKLGILFSFQQGVTIGHAPDGDKRTDLFSEDAWAVTASGERCYGVFCANSEAVRKFTREATEKVLKLLQPDSCWPDDDLRIFTHGTKEEICFCDRCLRLFNQKYGHSFTRKELSAQLFGEKPSAKIRKEWTLFNGESLRGFAACYREAVDNAYPSCRLGIQTVYSHWQYDGPDYKPIIDALSGPERKKVGVRPGAGYYLEVMPGEMMIKALGVGEEAARCKKYGDVGQLCYEAENYPHISAQKSPEAQMIECSLALASGMDSLALYWGSDKNAEDLENYMFYYDNLVKYKPYFLKIRDSFRDSHLAGGAIYHGSNTLAEKEWCSKEDQNEFFLMRNALPIVRENSDVEFHILNERAVRELSEADLPKVFSGTVLMDIAATRLFTERFHQLIFPKKVHLEDSAEVAKRLGGEEIFEYFGDNRKAINHNTVITPVSEDVKKFSSFTHDPEHTAGVCTIPTIYGGNVVLMQYFRGWMWNGFRRKSILDALDSVIPGGMSVRLMTNGFSVNVLARKDDQTGKTIGAFLLNLSIGETMDLELAIRNPAFEEYQMFLPKQAEPVKLTLLSGTASEKRYRIPALTGWQSALITGVK